MWKFLGVVSVAMLLAAAAPLMGAGGQGPMLPAALPWPQVDAGEMAQAGGGLLLPLLAMGFLLVQCLLIVLLVTPLRPLLRRMAKALLRPLRHGLFGVASWRRTL